MYNGAIALLCNGALLALYPTDFCLPHHFGETDITLIGNALQMAILLLRDLHMEALIPFDRLFMLVKARIHLPVGFAGSNRSHCANSFNSCAMVHTSLVATPSGSVSRTVFPLEAAKA